MNIKEAGEVMGFGPGTTIDEANLNERYHVLAKKLHPDMGGTTEAFQELLHAYNTLKGALKRPQPKPRQSSSRTPTGAPAPCKHCNGKGTVLSRRAWSSMKVRCPMCKGAGTLERFGV